jgi:hypothetical protein
VSEIRELKVLFYEISLCGSCRLGVLKHREPVMEDTTLDRYIVDYLLRTGRQSSAKALAEKRGIEVGSLLPYSRTCSMRLHV